MSAVTHADPVAGLVLVAWIACAVVALVVLVVWQRRHPLDEPTP